MSELLLIHSDDADGSTTFVDSSGNGVSLTAVGSVHHETDQHKFGASSIYFDGSGDYISCGSSIISGTGDYTIDMWFFLPSLGVQRTFFDNRTSGSSAGVWFGVLASNVLGGWGNNATLGSGSTTISANTWHHAAMVRSSGVVKIYLDGVLQSSVSASYAVLSSSSPRIAGAIDGYQLLGYLDEIRITNTAEWTGAFTPPTQPYGAFADTYSVPVADSPDAVSVFTVVTEHLYARLPSAAGAVSVAPVVDISTDDLYQPTYVIGPTAQTMSFSVSRHCRFGLPSVNVPSSITPRFAIHTPSDCFRVWIYLDGVDVTDYLTGSIEVDEEESSSTLATFNLVNGLSLQSKQTIKIVVNDTIKTRDLFNGVLVTHVLKVDDGIVACTASTDLQGRIRSYGNFSENGIDVGREKLRSFIDASWHMAISDERGDEWEFMQELLDSKPVEIHIDRDGNLVKADWKAKDIPDVTITDATRVWKSLDGTHSQMSQIVNRNIVSIQRSFDRKKLREVDIGFLETRNIGFGAMNFLHATEDMVDSALNGTGWAVRTKEYHRPWNYVEGAVDISFDGNLHWVKAYNGGSAGYFTFEQNLVCGFSAKIYKVWSQGCIDTLIVDVKSQSSIDAVGERSVTEQWTVTNKEEVITEPQTYIPISVHSDTYSKGSVVLGDTVTEEGDRELILKYGTKLSNGDYYYDDITTLVEFDNLVSVAINRAETEILSCHRRHSESFTTVFSHDNKLSNTTRVVGNLSFKGKNRSLRHTIDTENGSALTEIIVAISGLQSQGIDEPNIYTPEVIPTNDALTDYSKSINIPTFFGSQIAGPKPDVTGYFTNNYSLKPSSIDEDTYIKSLSLPFVDYGNSIEIISPEITTEDSSDRYQEVQQEYLIDVPIDEYTLVTYGDC